MNDDLIHQLAFDLKSALTDTIIILFLIAAAMAGAVVWRL